MHTLKATTIPGLLRQMELSGLISPSESAQWMRRFSIPGLRRDAFLDFFAVFPVLDASDGIRQGYTLPVSFERLRVDL